MPSKRRQPLVIREASRDFLMRLKRVQWLLLNPERGGIIGLP